MTGTLFFRKSLTAFSKREEFKEVQSLGQQSEDLNFFEFETVTVDRYGKIIERETKQAQYFTEDLGEGVTLEMVAIPGNTFMMGSPEGEGSDFEKPQHEVTVQPFFMGKYPVTQAQWRIVAALPKVKRDLISDPSYFKGDNRPVEGVSWDDAVEFCERFSKQKNKQYRLPSEAEWEYACRAGTKTAFHFGETITTELANYDGDYTYASEPKGKFRGETTEVGKFFPNACGLYDMHGSIWEWCLDTWHQGYEGSPTDGTAWINITNNFERLLRGGSWDNLPGFCRSAFRSRLARVVKNDCVEFRVVVVGLARTL